MNIIFAKLLEETEEKEKVIKDKDLIIEHLYEKKERHSKWVGDLKSRLNIGDQEMENEKASVSRLKNEVEKWQGENSQLRSDLRGLRSYGGYGLQDAQAESNTLEQQLSEKEFNFRALQANLGEEQQARQGLKEELLQSRRTCAELERGLKNERLLSQSNQQAQSKDETIREQMRQLEEERELKLGLEEGVRDLQADVERTLVDSDRRHEELQSAEPRDWIIRRDEVVISEEVLSTGTWGKIFQGSFRGCQVAVKQIHELILSQYNRRLFEREMTIASSCRQPNLLQFIGATNDDGSPLFVTELFDTDLRKVLGQRSLHHEEIVCLALDVAIALNYLHLNKPFPIIHRDISSFNVLLWRRVDRWRAKLSDYGAANFMRQWMTSNPGARIYAAPEALTSQQSTKVSEA